MKTVLAYVPVLHRGYLDFFRKYGGQGNVLYVFGPELIAKFDFFRKDIRALDPEELATAVRSLHLFGRVDMANDETIKLFSSQRRRLIMPDEDVSRAVAEGHLNGCRIDFDSVFLRWDSKSSIVEKGVLPDRVVTGRQFDDIMNIAQKESGVSSGWWRRVGAVAARDGEILAAAHNHHVPSAHMPYALGDPRSYFKKGVNIEITTDFHAEASLIASAAANGICLSCADLYVTTFPCPPCGKLIAYSGIRRVFFREGYSMLDSQNILKARGIEIIRVVEEK